MKRWFIGFVVVWLTTTSAQAQTPGINLADVIRRASPAALPFADSDITAVVRACTPLSQGCPNGPPYVRLYRYNLAAFEALFGSAAGSATPSPQSSGDVFLTDAVRAAPPLASLAPGDLAVIVTADGLRRFDIGATVSGLAASFPIPRNETPQPRANEVTLAQAIASAPDLGRAIEAGDLGFAVTNLGVRRYDAAALHDVADDTQLPGPSEYLARNPPYQCVHPYFVSATATGSGNGTNTAPWTLDQAIEEDHNGIPGFAPGTCVNLAPGLYIRHATFEQFSGGNASTPTGFVVWRCANMPFRWTTQNGLTGAGNPNTGCIIRGENVSATVPFQGYIFEWLGRPPGCTTTNEPTLMPCTGYQDLVRARANYLIWDGIEFDGNTERGHSKPVVNFGCIGFNPPPGQNPWSLQLYENVPVTHGPPAKHYFEPPYPRHMAPVPAAVGGYLVHHVLVLNTNTHGCGWNGLDFENGDYMAFFHNAIHDTSGCWLMGASEAAPPNGCRGLPVNTFNCCGSAIHPYMALTLVNYTRTPFDEKWYGWDNAFASPPAHESATINFSYNVNFDTTNNPASPAYDANGIQMDGFGWMWSILSSGTGQDCPTDAPHAPPGGCPFLGTALMYRNLLFNNGGAGADVFFGGTGMQAWFVQNTAYGNAYVPTTQNTKGQLVADRSSGVFFGNIAISTSNARTLWVVANGYGGWVGYNVSYPTGRISIPGGAGQAGNVQPAALDPMFRGGANVLTTNQNFALQPGSSAINVPGLLSGHAGSCLPALEKCP